MATDFTELARQLAGPLAGWLLPFDTTRIGTFTPTYVGGTTAGVTTYTTQVGQWARLGNIVFVQGQVAWSAATGTGTACIGMPFVAAANGSGAVRVQNVTFANSAPEVLILGGNSFFTLDSPLTNAAGTAVAVEAAGNIVFNVWYFI